MQGRVEPRLQTESLRPLWPRSAEAERWTWGYQVVDFADAVGRPLLPWQQYAVVHLLELDRPGHMRWRVALLLVARQNGKSHLMRMLALWAMVVGRWPLVLSLAQDLALAEDMVNEAYGFCVEPGEDGLVLPERRELADEVVQYMRRNGDRQLIMRYSRWLAKAAGRSAARGRSADLVLWDEMREDPDWETWAAVVPTRLTREDGLVLCLSNAGDRKSVPLRALRAGILAGMGWPDGPPEADLADVAPERGVCLLEWSAPPECDLTLESAAWANPSLGALISDEAMESSLRGQEAAVRTEHLCQWVSSSAGAWLSERDWAACRIPDDAVDWEMQSGGRMLGVAIDPRGEYAALAVAGLAADGYPQVEVVAARPWWDWVVDWCSEHAGKYDGIVLAGSGWSGSLADQLPGRVYRLSGPQLGAAHRRLEQRVREGVLRHLGQPVLEASRAATVGRRVGDDTVVSWSAGGAAAPLLAVVLAQAAVGHAVVMPPRGRAGLTTRRARRVR